MSRKAGLGFAALDSKSTWSSFDDIAWDDFGGAGDDRSVPDPDEAEVAVAVTRKKEAASNKVAKKEELLTSKLQASTEEASMEVDNWDVADLGAVPDNLIVTTCKEDEAGLYNEEDTSVASTCNFSFSDVATEGDIGLFGAENEVDKGGTLMQYAWDNLDDMNDIFQNGDASFVQDVQVTDVLLQWPSSSASPESTADAKASSTPELRAMKGKLHSEDVKMEFIPCDSFDNNKEICASNSEDDTSAGRFEEPSEAPSIAASSEKVLEVVPENSAGLSPTSNDIRADEIHSGKRQVVNRRLDKVKKHSSHHKRPPSDYSKHQQSASHFQSGQPLQLKPSVASSLQVYPPMVPPPMLAANPMQQRSQHLPYMHSAYGMVHHTPYVLPQQTPQQVIMGFQPRDPQAMLSPEARHQLEGLSPPPASGSNMTPQEKIEKLRWKQKMNRLAASEQQQAVNQASSLSPTTKEQAAQMQERLPSNLEVLKLEEEKNVVDTAVLNQLLGIMSKLDVGTRVCIRDALYRLAKSAVCRQTPDGSSSSERSPTRPQSSEKNHLTRQIGFPLLETVTNPIDRTMANLLFHRRPGSSEGSGAENQNHWISQQQQQHQHQHQQQQQQHQQQQQAQQQQQQQHQQRQQVSKARTDFLNHAETSDAAAATSVPAKASATADGSKAKHGLKRDLTTNCSEFWGRAKRSSCEQE